MPILRNGASASGGEDLARDLARAGLGSSLVARRGQPRAGRR